MPTPGLVELIRAAGLDPRQVRFNEQDQQAILRAMETAPHDPLAALLDVIRLRHRTNELQAACTKAAEAATNLENMLKQLLSGNALFYRALRVRELPTGPRVVCRTNGQLREFSIHPEVDVERLRTLKPWDYVTVTEQVVVGYWADDPALYTDAQGQVVEFKGYQDREQHTVRISQGPEERIAILDRSLWDTPLTPQVRLVLHRDDPASVIATVPMQTVQSRFEIPIDKLHTRLEDLAGIEDIAERLLEDVLLRTCRPDIRDRFGLEPLKGVLLYSYKPGMGKTAFMRAIALWLHEHSDQFGFDVLLYAVKPNETKSMWHGEDARIMREDLWGAIRARQAVPRQRALVQIVVLDEIDSLGKRAGRGEAVFSAAQSEGLEAMLVEMDGLVQDETGDGPPAYVLCAGLTNRPDRVDEAAKRPGRFSLVLAMPDVNQQGAEDIMAIYARGQGLPWQVDGEIRSDLGDEVIRSHFLRPALAQLFDTVVLRYATDTQRTVDVTAGQILSNAHYMDVMNRAKKRAAVRHLKKSGVPGVTFDDVMDCLVDVACEAARQMEADPQMLVRQLEVKLPVARVDVVPRRELEEYRYLRVQSA